MKLSISLCVVRCLCAVVDRNEGFFAAKLLMLILCAVRFTVNIRGVTSIISPNFETDKGPQYHFTCHVLK